MKHHRLHNVDPLEDAWPRVLLYTAQLGAPVPRRGDIFVTSHASPRIAARVDGTSESNRIPCEHTDSVCINI